MSELSKASLERVRALCDEIHGHGADTLEGEMWRLRGILNRIGAVLGTGPVDPQDSTKEGQ